LFLASKLLSFVYSVVSFESISFSLLTISFNCTFVSTKSLSTFDFYFLISYTLILLTLHLYNIAASSCCMILRYHHC
jgi:hypothetical protein